MEKVVSGAQSSASETTIHAIADAYRGLMVLVTAHTGFKG